MATGTPTSLFCATDSLPVANTTTATSLFSAGYGTNVLPAGSLFAGRTLRLVVYGYFSTAALLPTLTAIVKLGGVTLISAALSSIVGSLTNKAFTGVFTFTCRTTGSTGTVFGQGYLTYSLSGTAKRDDLIMTAPAVVDTTVDNFFDIMAQWSTASASNSLTRTNMIVELLN